MTTDVPIVGGPNVDHMTWNLLEQATPVDPASVYSSALPQNNATQQTLSTPPEYLIQPPTLAPVISHPPLTTSVSGPSQTHSNPTLAYFTPSPSPPPPPSRPPSPAPSSESDEYVSPEPESKRSRVRALKLKSMARPRRRKAAISAEAAAAKAKRMAALLENFVPPSLHAWTRWVAHPVKVRPPRHYAPIWRELPCRYCGAIDKSFHRHIVLKHEVPAQLALIGGKPKNSDLIVLLHIAAASIVSPTTLEEEEIDLLCAVFPNIVDGSFVNSKQLDLDQFPHLWKIVQRRKANQKLYTCTCGSLSLNARKDVLNRHIDNPAIIDQHLKLHRPKVIGICDIDRRLAASQ